MSILVTCDVPDLNGQQLKEKVVDPEVKKFESWYSDPKHAGTGLLPMERDILTLYLHAKLSGEF